MPEIPLPDVDPLSKTNDWGDALTTGETLKMVHTLWFSEYNASPFMAFLTDKPTEELQEMLKSSEAAEKSIFDKLKAAASEWEAQAAQTLLLEKVLEYVRTPEVSHTSNEWKQIQGGAWEISNRVYQMRYVFVPVPQSKAVRVTWGIVYNTPQQPENSRYTHSWGDSRYIVRQEKKTVFLYVQYRWDISGRYQNEKNSLPDNGGGSLRSCPYRLPEGAGCGGK